MSGGKIGTHAYHFSPEKSRYLCMADTDMFEIPTEVIENKLDIDPSYKPIKQKERRYTP
jgi:hypothetical protein